MVQDGALVPPVRSAPESRRVPYPPLQQHVSEMSDALFQGRRDLRGRWFLAFLLCFSLPLVSSLRIFCSLTRQDRKKFSNCQLRRGFLTLSRQSHGTPRRARSRHRQPRNDPNPRFVINAMGWRALLRDPDSSLWGRMLYGVIKEEIGSKIPRYISSCRKMNALYKTGQGGKALKEWLKRPILFYFFFPGLVPPNLKVSTNPYFMSPRTPGAHSEGQ